MKPNAGINKLLKIGSFAMVAAILAVALWLGAAAWRAKAQGVSPAPVLSVPEAPQGGPFKCDISNIAVFSARIHVFCAAKVAGTNIQYFAAAGDSAHMITTNRFLMMLNTAYTLGKPVYIYYLDNPASNPPGCGTGDCRAIDWMFIVP